ncbi:SEFIR domain-containing protein [Brasilonema bromeliae]|uniref:SEFIR domain-containing protein n=1 Tax=Brasilonema bromeliae SPC951 TaxID=385972 RepID=A0ABX1P5F5_9CYAN|nr:SEFIR domain-containing protein [Brasilonema bromeliae]NMG19584.1 hypothetical protein [Brasilonema bromeliae SPC951]
MTEQIQTPPPPKVFISYSWDSDEHKNRVLGLANSLKNYGIDSKIDRYQQSPREGWYRWMMNQIEESDFVLVVCTDKYNLRYQNKEKRGQGRGATWEGGLIIADLYEAQGMNDKFIPILLSPEYEKDIPSSLKTYTVYRLFDPKDDPKIPGGFQELYRRLMDQPECEEPKLGKPIILPPIQPAISNVGGDGEIIKYEDPDNTQKTEQIQTATKVFISYSWDSDDHKENVLKLANTLRAVWGIEADIDRYVRAEPPYTPVKGWDLWMSERIKWAEFVLIIFTETYQRRFEGNEEPEKGLGVSWEGTIIRNDLYNAQLRDTKFIPVVFSQSDLDYVSSVLNPRDKYILTDDKSFTELCYRLRKQKTIIKPEIKGGPLPLPSDPVLFSPQKPPVKSLEQQQTPEIEYRKKVEEYANGVSLSEPYDDIDEIHKTILETIGLDTDKAKAIEDDILQSRRQRHEIYKKNLQKYQNLLMKNLEKEGFFSDDILSNLKQLQNNLGLIDKDTEELLLYAQLEYSLKKGSWIEADETTTNLLLKVANVKQNYFNVTDFRKIPCKDIRKIDELWTQYSKGNFGYSAQIDIWQQVNGELLDFFVALDWGYKEDHRFVYTENFKYNIRNHPKGHRPVSVLWEGGTHETRQAYINRIQQCCTGLVP